MNGVNEIRTEFLEFFARNGHEIVASSPLIPRNDPTLMFTNAGMVQFKNVFTGLEKRPYRRAASAQKCVRAGGKHNDLDKVGYTARHHTFFEMLGNFSFGDYFKAEAIEFAFTLLTKHFDLPKKRLLVTVYHDDDEAYELWKKIAGFPAAKIIRIPTSDNFWSMGDAGPCGPSSEIFFDQGDEFAGGPPGSADEDGDRFLEFWNLVFMQYEQIRPGERIGLPRPSIDTGMGIERIAAILQGVPSNYDIDLMRALILAVSAATGVDPDGPQKASHRVIADHLRASAFLVAAGVLPSNEGRGYVLRRIMRRAMRHAQLLGTEKPLLCRLVPVLVREMGQAYPELVRAQALIVETLQLEETRFRVTLTRGLAMLDEVASSLPSGAVLPGNIAFKLYDTYGFPLDLTEDHLRLRHIKVDRGGFDAAMQLQRIEARKAWAGSGEAVTESIWFDLRAELGAIEFLGYDTECAEGIILAIVKDGLEVVKLLEGERGQIIVNQTPFYGESGGQMGDRGSISGPNLVFHVTDTKKKLGDLIIHEGWVEHGQAALGREVTLKVDHGRRSALRANHSATHLLHEALRRVLGDHVAQKGSLVAPDRLRFDFAHQKPIGPEELARIEDIANRAVLANAPVETRLMDLDDAIASGARALFGEKYGDQVRVVSMGNAAEILDDSVDASRANAPFSVELCGGTHVSRTGDIGLISILSESPVAAGVRRIEAKTRDAARHHLNAEARRLQELAHALRTPQDEAADRLAQVLEERRKLERDLAEARKQLAMGGAEAAAIEEIGGVKFLGKEVSGVEMKDLKSLADEGKRSLGSGVVAIVGVGGDGKAGVVVGVTEDLTRRFDAIALARLAAEKLGGKGGGGRRDLAQAGGPNGASAPAALAAIAASLREPADAV